MAIFRINYVSLLPGIFCMYYLYCKTNSRVHFIKKKLSRKMFFSLHKKFVVDFCFSFSIIFRIHVQWQWLKKKVKKKQTRHFFSLNFNFDFFLCLSVVCASTLKVRYFSISVFFVRCFFFVSSFNLTLQLRFFFFRRFQWLVRCVDRRFFSYIFVAPFEYPLKYLQFKRLNKRLLFICPFQWFDHILPFVDVVVSSYFFFYYFYYVLVSLFTSRIR